MMRPACRGRREAGVSFLICAASINWMTLARPYRLTGKPRRGRCIAAALTPAEVVGRSIEHDVIVSPQRQYA